MSYPQEGLRFIDLRRANVSRCNGFFHPIESWSPTDWACAMAGEAGEACNQVKKLRRLDGSDGGQKLNKTNDADEIVRKIGEELADTIIYIDLLAARLGINLAYEVAHKFNAVSERLGSPYKIEVDHGSPA